ncbi:peptide ABC transporter substrate-binding protein [Marinicella rhabdoformis]|uniref:peptide ABC transporter substrate-binding protein n=1 Tax=Marinicella rhabdoformis TaxID=2580566 RepID=UPI0012AEBCFE|nr:peptide ABC transporter substrate-binding protein [Marinicella rhabdoformis]
MNRIFIVALLLLVFNSDAQTLNRGNGGEPDSLNPHKAQGLNSHHILYDLYEGLFRYGVDGTPVLAMAAAYQVSADGLTWTFDLRPDAKWSNGEPVTSSDFLRGWQQASDPATAAPYGGLFDNLKDKGKLQVTRLSDFSLQVRLNQANPMFSAQLVLPVFMPTHKQEGVFNGAYILSDWQLQEKITLSKNLHYADASAVYFNEIVYWVTENQNSELNRFRSGELDITETIPDAKIEWLKQNMPNELRIAPYYGTFFLGLDVRDQWLQNVDLRQALYWSIDRNILVEKVLKSGQKPALSLIPGSKQNNGLNLIKAKAALSNSGFDVKTNKLTLLYNSSQNQKKVALAVAAMWRQNLGIKTQLKNQEWKVFVSSRKKPGKQVFRGGWVADYHDPMNFLQLFHSASQFNYYGFNSTAYDELLQRLLKAEPAEQHTLITQAERVLADEAPMIPLYHYVSRHLVRSGIKGFEDNPLDQHLSRYLKQRNEQ